MVKYYTVKHDNTSHNFFSKKEAKAYITTLLSGTEFILTYSVISDKGTMFKTLDRDIVK